MGRSAHESTAREAFTRADMDDLEPLFTEIATLLDRPEREDDPARLERTLTDGYAQALTLEAERTTLERKVLRLSLELDANGEAMLSEVQQLARRLHDCDESSERLRGELVRLKRRHAQAVHSRPGWA
jgi:hypothetical protein